MANSVWHFISYLFRHTPSITVVYTLLVLGFALMDAMTSILVAPIFDLLINKEAQISDMSSYTQWILNTIEPLGLPHTALTMMLLFLALVVLRNIIVIFADAVSIYLRERIIYKLKIDAFEAVLNANWSFFLNRNQGEFINVLTREVVQTHYAFVEFFFCVSYTLQICLFASVALMVSWQLTLACGFTAVALLLPFILLTRWNYRWGQSVVTRSSEANGVIQETFSLAKVIQSFANQNIIMSNLKAVQRQILKLKVMSHSTTAFLQHAYYPLGLLSVIFGYYLSLRMQLSFSELSVILFVMWKSAPILSGLIRQIGLVSEHLPSFQKLLQLQAEALAQPMYSGVVPFNSLKHSICLEKVSFQYQIGKSSALYDLSLEIPRGQMIALVGPSGAGKSTLVDVLMGFHKITQGRFEIDGHNFYDLDIQSYRRKVGYVPQNSVLFNASIRENFTWIEPTLTDQDIFWACEQAYAREFIEKLPEGLDTQVGDRGVRLSGGQVQRLALARAIARRPELLILDEATSALDVESEAFVQQSINKLSQEMTILVIAHRFSTIKQADLVYVLEEGRILQKGTLQVLEAEEGLFQKMLRQQHL